MSRTQVVLEASVRSETPDLVSRGGKSARSRGRLFLTHPTTAMHGPRTARCGHGPENMHHHEA